MNFKKRFLSILIVLAKRSIDFVCYPQYLLFLSELLFLGGMFVYSLKYIKSWMSLLTVFSIIGLCLAYFKFINQKDFNYGSIKEQLNDTEGKGIALKTSVPKYYRKFHYYFLVFSIILIILKGMLIGDPFINDLGIVIGLILFVFELFINCFTFSPFLFVLLMLGITTIVNSIGSNTTILNWSFLLLIFGTIIGENFFEEDLVEEQISKELSKENLILRKISNYIGLVFLYFGIVLSESIVNSTYYYIKFTSVTYPIISSLQIFVVKSIVLLLAFVVYLGTEKKIIYLIFRFYYRDTKLKISNSLVRVFLDKNEKWRVRRVIKRPKKLETTGINTYLDKKHNVFYVKKKSEIPKKIDGLNKNEGNNILGKINAWTIIWFTIMIAIIPIVYFLDCSIRVNDGIYEIVEKSDKTDNLDEIIKVSGDAIVYKGKVEALDKRTQSFEHGTILLRKIEKKDIEEKKGKKEKKVLIYKKDKKAIIYIKPKKTEKEDDIYIVLIKKLGSEENKG